MIPYRRGSKGRRGSLRSRSESCRCSGSAPPPARWPAGRGRPAAARDARAERALKSWPQLVFAGVVDHALDIDDVFLVMRVEQKLGAAARTRQIDIDDLLDATGR